MTTLFDPVRLGRLTLPNRIVMAPLTRNRAGRGNVPTQLMAEYYAQRASAGLIVSEATQICPEGQGYEATPGLHSPEQVAGWQRVTAAVHDRGSHIFAQLWHVGRVSHTALQPQGRQPVAPSAITAKTKTFLGGKFVDVSEPRALLLDELPGIVESYRIGAANAIAAGFDGVEIHGANGYLLDQFLRNGSNRRTDTYGGSIENRARLMLEVTQAIVSEVGPERTGIRLSPVTPANDASDDNPQPLLNHVVEQLDRLGLVYIHMIEGQTGGDREYGAGFDYGALRSRFRNTWIVNNGYTPETAKAAVAEGRADMVAFGRSFISNPDLVERLRHNAPLSPADRTTFYGGDGKGYTDYPTLLAAE